MSKTDILKYMQKIYRSKNAAIAGVVAGLAEHWGIDTFALRLIMIVLLFATGFFPVVVIYIILWLYLPKQPTQPQ